MNDQMFRPSVGITVYLAGLILANTLSIGLVLKWRSGSDDGVVELTSAERIPKQRDRCWRAAVLISILSIVSVAGLGNAVFDLHERIYPKGGGVRFAPYDI